MPALTDTAIRHALKRVEISRKQENLADGEGRGTGRLVLVLKPMPKRVTADWMAQQWRDGKRTKKKIPQCRSHRPARSTSATLPTSFRRAEASRSPPTSARRKAAKGAPAPAKVTKTKRRRLRQSLHVAEVSAAQKSIQRKWNMAIANTLMRTQHARSHE